MRIPIHQLDAFTSRVFGGNPAAVCPLPHWLEDDLLQNVAAENNLSETAFLVERGEDYELRWFTPKLEVDLCGHATLASAHVVLHELRPKADSVRFHTKSGVLSVERKGEQLAMDFPAQPGEACDAAASVAEALGGSPTDVYRSVHYDLIVYASEAEVRALAPDASRMEALEPLGFIATAPGDEEQVDFVSRFFAPKAGIYEDPVTGSAHCVSAPYWAERLGRTELLARQISERVGEVTCTVECERVLLAGEVAPYLRGEIEVPDASPRGA